MRNAGCTPKMHEKSQEEDGRCDWRGTEEDKFLVVPWKSGIRVGESVKEGKVGVQDGKKFPQYPRNHSKNRNRTRKCNNFLLWGYTY